MSQFMPPQAAPAGDVGDTDPRLIAALTVINQINAKLYSNSPVSEAQKALFTELAPQLADMPGEVGERTRELAGKLGIPLNAPASAVDPSAVVPASTSEEAAAHAGIAIRIPEEGVQPIDKESMAKAYEVWKSKTPPGQPFDSETYGQTCAGLLKDNPNYFKELAARGINDPETRTWVEAFMGAHPDHPVTKQWQEILSGPQAQVAPDSAIPVPETMAHAGGPQAGAAQAPATGLSAAPPPSPSQAAQHAPMLLQTQQVQPQQAAAAGGLGR